MNYYIDESEFDHYDNSTFDYENLIWEESPKILIVIVYSIVIPTICFFGTISNVMILLILKEKVLQDSTSTYLTVLAYADLVSCILLFFSGLSRGFFWKQPGWMVFDVFVYLPLSAISANIATLATIGVATDRLIIMLGSGKICQSKFCTQSVARKLMAISIILIHIINLPFLFTYKIDTHGHPIPTEISHSCFFNVLNWMQLIFFGLLPATFLLISNSILIFALRRTFKQRKMFLKYNQIRVEKNLREQTRLTITLIGIVFLFLIGEVPTHLASRRSAVSILYAGNPENINKSLIEIFRLVATFLNSISCSANFVLYCLLNPRFLAALKALFKKKLDRRNGMVAKVSTIRCLSQ